MLSTLFSKGRTGTLFLGTGRLNTSPPCFCTSKPCFCTSTPVFVLVRFVETKRGRQLGQVVTFVRPEDVTRRRGMRIIERMATPRDLEGRGEQVGAVQFGQEQGHGRSPDATRRKRGAQRLPTCRRSLSRGEAPTRELPQARTEPPSGFGKARGSTVRGARRRGRGSGVRWSPRSRRGACRSSAGSASA